jgi:hypothetical protein
MTFSARRTIRCQPRFRRGYVGTDRLAACVTVRLLSFMTASTIAAACAWRTVSGVVAIRACLGSEGPGRKGLRQLRRGFKAAAYSFADKPGVRRRGLGTRTSNCFRGHARRLRCTHPGKCRSQRSRAHPPSRALPPAVFPHPGRSLCWITIRHTFYSDACSVYRVPVDPVTT